MEIQVPDVIHVARVMYNCILFTVHEELMGELVLVFPCCTGNNHLIAIPCPRS